MAPRLLWERWGARRFGPPVAVLLAIALVAAIASTGHDTQDLAVGGTSKTAAATAKAKVAQRDPDLPITGKMPNRADDAFKRAGSVYKYDTPPAEDRPPSYPSPRGGG